MVKTSKRVSAKPKRSATSPELEKALPKKTVLAVKLSPETRFQKEARANYVPDPAPPSQARLIGEKICRWANGGCNCAANKYPKLCHNVEEIAAAVLELAR